uniref:4HBT domain-containing protein n=1 Tax=Heterorhabditis bacteriophora TaxID=37862 RepID=A0A1I7WZT7_HETBA
MIADPASVLDTSLTAQFEICIDSFRRMTRRIRPLTANNSIIQNDLSSGYQNGTNVELNYLIEEFESLSTIENFNRAGSKVSFLPIFKSFSLDSHCLKPLYLNFSLEKISSNFKIYLSSCSFDNVLNKKILISPIISRLLYTYSYLLPVKLNDVIEITATVLKLGRNVAFTEAEFRRKSDGKLAAKGKHTLALLPKQSDVEGRVLQY